jgi:uncharacterized protein (DUF983 family)
MSDERINQDRAIWPEVDPISAGLKGRCPRCGEGRLFSGFLTVGKRCVNCGLDYSFADAGDGPAVFVILIAGFAVAFAALFTEFALAAPDPMDTAGARTFAHGAQADQGRADHAAIPQQGGRGAAGPAGMNAGQSQCGHRGTCWISHP